MRNKLTVHNLYTKLTVLTSCNGFAKTLTKYKEIINTWLGAFSWFLSLSRYEFIDKQAHYRYDFCLLFIILCV
jgi:hypothetical protein